MNAPVSAGALLKTSLYFSEGSSDKEYHAEVVAQDGGYVVNFRYGRRGAALTCGCKTPSPVDFDKATKVFEKLVKEKTAKGYSPDVSGTAYQGTEKAGLKSDFVPQLLNSITRDEAMRLIEDDDWVMQEKKDGERRGAQADPKGEAEGYNRKGLVVPLAAAVAEQLKARASVLGLFRVDAESIGDNLFVFDLLIDSGESCKALGLGYLERMTLARQSVAGCKNVIALPVAITTAEKRELWNKVEAAKGEGLVFKRRNSIVTEGRPNSGGDMLKFKFTERATCICAGINAGKRSISIELLDNTAAKDVDQWPEVSVGNCTIPPSYDMPEVGALVEIEYLYAYKGGSLYQPVYRGERKDLDSAACTMSQLKFKPEGQDDDQ